MQYVPLWTCILKSRKVGGLPPDLFRFWILCLVSAQEHDHRRGTLPSLDDLAYSLHMETSEVAVFMSQLVTRDFVTDRDGVYAIHDWSDWKQLPDPTSAERKRRQRARIAKSPCSGHVTHEPHVTGVTADTDVTVTRDVTDVTESGDVTRYQSRAEQSSTETPLSPRGAERAWKAAVPSPVNPPPAIPELERVASLAAELSGDVAWSIWVNSQARLGHPLPAIEQALNVCVNKGKWSRELAAGVLRRLASEGYPEPAKPSVVARPGEYRSQAKAYKIIPGP